MQTALPQTGEALNEAGVSLENTIRLVSVNPSLPMHNPRKPDRAWLLELGHKLQATLDVEELVRLFGQHFQELAKFDTIGFDNIPANIATQSGGARRHRVHYDLVLGETKLGKIVLTRDKRFSEQETQALEEALCMLVHPLRNALLYREAVNAAATDPLTGLNNRARMDAVLDRDVDLASRHGTPLSLIMLDVDHFKRINDTHGHVVGDCVLRKLAERIRDRVRDSDVCFRYGGEEFTLVLSNTRLKGAMFLAERIRDAISQSPMVCEDIELDVTVSLGVAALEPRDNAHRLIEKADEALYQSKSLGRDRVTAWRLAEPTATAG